MQENQAEIALGVLNAIEENSRAIKRPRVEIIA
jgi:hypothetical protein